MLSAYLLPLTTSGPLQAHFGRLSEHARQGEQQQWTGSARARGSSSDGAAVDVEAEARRAALDFFVSLLRDVVTYFPETGGAAAAAEVTPRACSVHRLRAAPPRIRASPLARPCRPPAVPRRPS
jgi:hypothetical protein